MKGLTMAKTDLIKVTVCVSKTIQEEQFQPRNILIEQETYTTPDNVAELRADMFDDINNDINAFFKKRKE